ncbi:homeodomain transcription factor [Lithospermum erythrorhizon]|uniref:Homeodomain transcription factor n=1 Tax=Lithospermum erythrorhizon TaxID=34254 RepID=A0AAV3RC70_LITER
MVRCGEKQRKEASQLQAVNRKLRAMNKLPMEEDDRLQKQVSHPVYENGCFRLHTQTAGIASKDTNCESVVTVESRLTVTSGQHRSTSPRDAGPHSLLGSRVCNYGGQVILPLAHTIEHEEASSMNSIYSVYELLW